jgi:hypothetical protein
MTRFKNPLSGSQKVLGSSSLVGRSSLHASLVAGKRGGAAASGSTYPTSTSTYSNDMAVAAASGGGDDSMPNADSNSDSWILDFGLSVTNHESQTRKIRSEIEQITNETQGLLKGVENEKRTEAQLAKDTRHAHSEMNDFTRNAQELLENTRMNQDLRKNLEKTLHHNIVRPVKGEDAMEGVAATPADNDQDKENSTPKSNKVEEAGITTIKFLQTRELRHEQECGVQAYRNENDSIQSTINQTKALVEEIQSIASTIQTENLHQVLAQKKQETELRRRELEAENERKHTTQTRTEEARRNAAVKAQECVHKRKLFDENKALFEAEEAALRQKLEQAEAELRGLKTKEEWEAELSELEAERDNIIKMIAEAEDVVARIRSTKAEKEAILAAVEELKTTERDIQAKVHSAKTSLEEALKRLENVQQEASQVEEEKLVNDKFEVEVVLPARSKINDILKEKEQLTSCINDAHEDLKRHQEKATAKEQEEKTKLQQLEEQEKELQKQVNEADSKYQANCKEKHEEDEAVEKELRELATLQNNLENAAKAEHSLLEDQKLQRSQKMEVSKQALAEAKKELEGKNRYKAILEVGQELLDTERNVIASLDDDNEEEGGEPEFTSPLKQILSSSPKRTASP